jgi:hypothetical protein
MSCSFLPPILISADIIRGSVGVGGIAENVDGTRFASVDSDLDCVYIYSVADRTADAIIVGTTGTAGSGHGFLKYPVSTCFVHRDGVDTLLICDYGNGRIVEVTVRGEFMRAIALPEYRSHCVMVQNDKLQSPEDLFLRSFELQKIE